VDNQSVVVAELNQTYKETLRYLFSLQKFGIKLGLKNIRALCALLGNPQNKYPTIHVAGTNGKGSTSAFLASICTEAGYQTGLYTSPHLVDFSERIRINGSRISSADIVRLLERIRNEIDRLHCTFFEATTAIAFQYFAEQAVDIAVIETGLGGRLDSTNLLEPLATIITSIGLEHSEYLGDSFASIAFEKAGIIKPNTPVFYTVQHDDAKRVIEARAAELGAPTRTIASPDTVRIHDINAMTFECTVFGELTEFVSPLIGAFQARNALLAIRCVESLVEKERLNFSSYSLKDGISNVLAHSGLSARLQQVQSEPELVIDVAHNPAGVEAMLTSWLCLRRSEATHLVLGMLQSKNVREVLSILAKHVWASVTAVEAKSTDSFSPDAITRIGEDFQMQIRCATEIASGVRNILRHCRAGESVLLFGSHYVVGEYLATQQNVHASVDT